MLALLLFVPGTATWIPRTFMSRFRSEAHEPTMTARRQAYLRNRDGRYHFRRRIPAALQSEFAGKREFRVALRTSDPDEAQRLARHHTLETSKQLDAARARLGLGARERFTAAELRSCADEVEALWLQQDDQMRRDASPRDLDELEAATSALVEVVEAHPPHRQMRAEADGFLRAKGFAVHYGSQAYWQVVEAVRAGCAAALRKMSARARGEPRRGRDGSR